MLCQLNENQRRFAEQLAGGANGVEAYLSAYGLEATSRQRRKSIAKRACELRAKPTVQALVAELRAAVGVDAAPALPRDSAAAAACTPGDSSTPGARSQDGDGVRAPDESARSAALLEALEHMTGVALRELGNADARRLEGLLYHWYSLAALEMSRRREV